MKQQYVTIFLDSKITKLDSKKNEYRLKLKQDTNGKPVFEMPDGKALSFFFLSGLVSSNKKIIYILPAKCHENRKPLFESLFSDITLFITTKLGDLLTTPEYGFLYSEAEGEINIKELFLQSFLSETSEQLKDIYYHATRRKGVILLTGPTGSGKTSAVNTVASKMKKEITSFNMAAIEKGLIESRLRGWIKGAFTGAIKDEKGLFEIAHHNILFIDEFQTASLEAQSQLLDIIHANSDTYKTSKIGDPKKIQTSELKLFVALNEDTQTLLSEKRLRTDLFYRISKKFEFKSLQDSLHSPPRIGGKELTKEDYLKLLIRLYFWKNIGEVKNDLEDFQKNLLFLGLHDKSLTSLIRYKWSGNHREFENFVAELTYMILYEGHIDDEINQMIIDDALLRIPSSDISFGTAPDGDISADVQNVMKEKSYKIVESAYDLKKLGHEEVGTREKLKSFLKMNYDSFPEEFASKIQRFIK